MTTPLPCYLGGVLYVHAPGSRPVWRIVHSSGPASVDVSTADATRIVAEGLAGARTYGEADSYAPGLLSQGMTPLDRFMADPDNEPSPGGIAARRAMFRP